MANFGYSSTAYVYQCKSPNSKVAYLVAGSFGEAADNYIATQGLAFLDQEFPKVEVCVVSPTAILLSSSAAGTSSGLSLTAQQWATTYSAIATVGASGTNSSTGAQLILVRSS